MEELIDFLEDLLSVTPPQENGATRRERLTLCLNEARELLAEVAARQADYGTLSLCVSYSCVLLGRITA